MYLYYVGEKITWNSAIQGDYLRSNMRMFIEKHGKTVVVHRIDKSPNAAHPQTIWLTGHRNDRFSGWWFEPITSGFILDAIA